MHSPKIVPSTSLSVRFQDHLFLTVLSITVTSASSLRSINRLSAITISAAKELFADGITSKWAPAGSDVTSTLIGYRPTGDARSHYVNVDWLSVAYSITRSPELTQINNFVPITMSDDDRSHYENVYWLHIADLATESHGQRSGTYSPHSSVVFTGSTRVRRPAGWSGSAALPPPILKNFSSDLRESQDLPKRPLQKRKSV